MLKNKNINNHVLACLLVISFKNLSGERHYTVNIIFTGNGVVLCVFDLSWKARLSSFFLQNSKYRLPCILAA